MTTTSKGKAAHGEGSIRVLVKLDAKGRKLGEGTEDPAWDEERGRGKWELRFTVNPIGGQTVRVSRTFTGTKAQARRRLRELQAEHTRQGVTDATATVGEYVGAFLAKQTADGAAEGTRRRYKGAADRHVLPKLGTVRLRDLSRRTVEAWYQELRAPTDPKARAFSRATVRQIHTVLRGALDLAVRDEVLPRNPLLGLALKATRAERDAAQARVKALDAAQAARFYAAALPDRSATPLAFCLLTGLRIGEALALRWESVDLKTGEVRIVATRSGGETGGVYEAPPKSAAGKRTIYASGDALALLRAQDERRREEAAARLPQWRDPEYVFFTLRGTPYRPDAMKRIMTRVCQAAGVPRLPVHSLRHAHISISLARGANIAAVSKHAGHSRVSITLDTYRHALPEERQHLTLNFGEAARIGDVRGISEGDGEKERRKNSS